MLDLVAAISSFDPTSLPLWLVASWAAAMYPIGMMLGAECSMCCKRDCQECEGSGCCGSEWPRADGVCCDDVWYMEAGVCCDGRWTAGVNLVCCEGQVVSPENCCGGQLLQVGDECCGNTLYPAAAPCPEGQVFLRWGAEEECCGCVPDMIMDGRTGEMVPTALVVAELCCPSGMTIHLPYADAPIEMCGGTVPPGFEIGCRGRCCVDGECSFVFQCECDELGGEWLGGLCDLGCPAPCCSEDADGNVQCEIENSGACSPPKMLTDSCQTGCVGECCVDGVSRGQTTQSDCFAMGGSWAGLGSTNCNDGKCRDPFSEACCETKQSGAAGLTFTQPRKKRSPAFYDTLRVTVTGTTDSPILIHGMPFGVVGKRCPFTVTFMLCWDKFNIEPVPCGSNFANLDVTVCWLQEDTQTETLNFSACDGLTVWLGYAPYNCTTTLVYAGDQKTTSAAIQMLGDGVIEANGGALVLTTPIAQLSSGDRKLTLSGTSVEPNTLAAGVPNPSEGTLAVDKVGVGLWRLAGLSSFSGQFRVISGTIVIANDVGESGASPVGTGTPIVGGDTIGEPAALLFVESGWLVERAVTVTGSSQPVVLGGLGGGLSQFSGDITLNRSVTLQASTDGTVRFTGPWVNNGGSTVVTVGSSGNAGTVQLDSFLPSTLAGLSVVNGTARLTTSNNRINPATPVTVGSSLGSATLDIDSVSQTLSNLTFAGNSASVTGGTLRLANSPSVAVTGTGHSISSVVELDNDATINVSGSLTVSGFVSGQGELKKDGTGTLTLSGPLSHTGGTEIAAGSIVTQTLVSGPPQFSSATFTPDSLTVEFSSAPLSGEQYKLLPSATLNAYNTVTLVNAGSATATYNPATSILTID